MYNMSIFWRFEIFSNSHSGAFAESLLLKLLIKSGNQDIFQKFQLNRNLQEIPFKMMYNMSMLRHRFSNEREGVRRELPSSPIL